jgi:hypothetical protein
MDMYGVILAVVVAAALVALAVYAARGKRAKALRDAETRRTVDKGKHVEL